MSWKNTNYCKTWRLLTVLLVAAPLMMAVGKRKIPTRELENPTEARSLLTLTRSVAAVGVESGRILMLSQEPGTERVAVASPYFAKGATREQVFGKLTDQTRFEIIPSTVMEAPNWRGVDVSAAKPLFLDGAAMTLHEVDPKTLKSIMQRSIPWDLIMPPRDRGGEGTKHEIATLRTAFKRAFLGTMPVKAVGMTKIPKSWGSGGKRQPYLMVMRVKGFPLVQIECEEDERSQCMVTRACLLEGASDLLPAAVTGIGVLPKDRLIVIGDRSRHRLLGFKFDSCLSVKRVRDWVLPSKIKAMSNLTIDSDGTLFVSTQMPDDYLNANLFTWLSGSW